MEDHGHTLGRGQLLGLPARSDCGHVNILLRQTALMPDLLEFLLQANCVVRQTAPDTLETTVPEAFDERQENLELELYLRVWQALNPDSSVRIVR
jgi:hypothetical protein